MMTLSDLMPPEVFPDAQFGMEVASVDAAADAAADAGGERALERR